MGLSVGIGAPFIAAGEYSLGGSGAPNYSPMTNKSTKDVSIHTTAAKKSESKPVSKEINSSQNERQKINSMIMPLFSNGASGEEIHKFLDGYKNNPQKTATLIADIIQKSALGMGTNEVGMSAAIYYINNETYPLVQKTLAKEGLSIEAIMDDELSGTEAQDLHRHLNQFKK